MPQPLPNLHHLELFYHVARSGGITAAVRGMPYGIQQPAVSGQISQLEKELGVRLFQRRPFQLTAAGRELYDFAAPFFGGLAAVADRVSGKAARHLRLAAPATVFRHHLPAVLARVRKACPDLELTLHDADQRTVFGMLEREEVDLAIAELEGRPPSGIRSEVLVSMPLLLLLPPGARLPRAGWPALAGALTLIRTPENTTMARLFQTTLARRSLSWLAGIEVGSLELVHSFVEQGFGAGLSLRVPGLALPKGVTAVELKGAPELKVAGLWRGKPTTLAAAVLDGLRRAAAG